MAQCATRYGGRISFTTTHIDTKLGTHKLHTQQSQLRSKRCRIAVVARESVAMASALLACHSVAVAARTGLSSSRQSNWLLQLGAVSSPSRQGIQIPVSNSADLVTTRNPMAFHPLAQVTKTLQDDFKKIAADKTVSKESVSVILLAGGKGTRMGASMPKQYLPLLGQPIALYSFYTFADMGEVMEIVVVCDPSYRDIFEEAGKNISVPLKFALPGKERQDSVCSGLQKIDKSAKLACVHDSARPLVLVKDIEMVIRDAALHGAAVLGVPVKATIKEAGSDFFVTRTLDRSLLWEMQTPQVIEPGLLARGFEFVEREGLDVTDDVSIVEHLKHPVFITQGSYTNLKVTTPDDLLVAERILHQTALQAVMKAVAT